VTSSSACAPHGSPAHPQWPSTPEHWRTFDGEAQSNKNREKRLIILQALKIKNLIALANHGTYLAQRRWCY
jgi:hypothetical protein